MTPIERLRRYARRYWDVNIIDNGFCTWTCSHEFSRRVIAVAARAMSMGFKVSYAKGQLTLMY